jgi:hypothetical protein
MAAGLGFKDFVTGEVLTAADVDGYLMQGVWVFADAAARTAAVTSPQEGNMSYLKDTNSTEYYSGSAWVAVGASNPSWTTWTPTINNLTQGNGTLTARYIQVGKVVNFFISFTFGSTSSMTGAMNFSLPVSSSQNIFTIYGIADDVGNVGYPLFAQVESNTAYVRAINTSGTYASATNVSATIPFTWGNTDRFNFSGSYEVA